MPQVHKGERSTTTFRPDLELKKRLNAAAAEHNFRHLNDYLVVLLGELHPDRTLQPEKAGTAVEMLGALLGPTSLAQEELELSPMSKSRAA
ncbi:hypothetical protein ACIBH1_45015 [Nonomuraea sp. NPDC050663]|uniref:hypothetical protein n=1 Tax=Nonomuraea sp. NPDC050663 TaxID=3364370 RepID=UPI0037A30697